MPLQGMDFEFQSYDRFDYLEVMHKSFILNIEGNLSSINSLNLCRPVQL